MKFFPAFCAVATLLFLIGCKSSSTTGPNSSVVIPGVGSYYIFDDVQIDSNGAIQFQDTLTFKIVQENFPHGGYNDVAQIFVTRSSDTSVRTEYWRFLSNGDIMWDALNFGSSPSKTLFGWLNLPFSGDNSGVLNFDSTFADSIWIGYDTILFTSHFNGTETLGLQSRSITMNEVTINEHVGLVTHRLPYVYENTSSVINYSPASGVFGGESDVSNNENGSKQSLDHETLIGYSVK
jgi:hypothetical protein